MQVKICGITNPDDARMAAEEGATAIGINFYPGSKRYVDLQVAKKIVEFAEPTLLRIGVTVNADFDILSSVWNSGVVDMFQFHGTESLEYQRTAAENGWPFYLAKRVKNPVAAAAALDDASSTPVPAILLDSDVPGAMGGTGHVIDWQMLEGLFEETSELTCILAGGLTSGNVYEAIQLVRPHFIDVASGVEETPRQKSRQKIQSLMREIQRAGNIR